jgi:hypothetical protein
MALLKRELHRASRGPILNDEDQWHLVLRCCTDPAGGARGRAGVAGRLSC